MSDWWARKMGAPASSVPARTDSPMLHGQPVNQHANPSSLPQKRQPPHQRASGYCPDCNSGNYFSMNGGRARCYDCGFPIVQSTSGATSVSNEGGKPTPAVQVHGVSNFHPGEIVGRIG